MLRWSCNKYEMGAEVQGDYAMYGLLHHDKPHVIFPLLEAGPVQVA